MVVVKFSSPHIHHNVFVAIPVLCGEALPAVFEGLPWPWLLLGASATTLLLRSLAHAPKGPSKFCRGALDLAGDELISHRRFVGYPSSRVWGSSSICRVPLALAAVLHFSFKDSLGGSCDICRILRQWLHLPEFPSLCIMDYPQYPKGSMRMFSASRPGVPVVSLHLRFLCLGLRIVQRSRSHHVIRAHGLCA